MEFTVAKSDLVRELALSQGVVEKKTTIPILSNVHLEASADRVVLTTTDLELGIRCACPATVQSEGRGTVPARRLLDYVRLLPDAGVHLKLTDTNWVNLVCGRSKTRIAGMSADSYPDLPEMPAPIARIPVGTLTTIINQTIFAISAEESRFTLSGALLLLRPDSAAMVSTDGHRLSLSEGAVDFGEDQPSHRGLVSKKALTELLKLMQEVGDDATVEFSADENHLFFKTAGRLLQCRKLTGNFPDFERVLPSEQPHEVRIPKDELRSTIERVAQFSDERSHAIRLQFKPGEINLHSSLSDTAR